MSFSFGSFAGGAAQGINNGIDMADKLRLLNDAARTRAARKALGSTYASDLPMDSGMGAVPPVTPPAPGQPSLPALGNTNPDPMMDGGAPMSPPSNDMSGMPSGGAPPPPQALPPPIAPPMPGPDMPATPDTPGTGAGGAPMSGVASPAMPPTAGPQDDHAAVTSSINDANNTIKAIAHAVKQANPNIDPETLFEATRQHIEQMKGVRNEVKDYMVAQTEMAKMQNRVLTTGMRINGQQGVAETRANAITDKANIDASSRRDVGAGHDKARTDAAGIAGKARTDAAGISAQGGVTRAQIAADANRYRTDENNKTRVYDTQLQQYVKVIASNTGADARVDAETARSGGTPPARKRLNPLSMPNAPGGAAPAPAAARTTQLPPQAAAALKEGVNTTFANGQVWTKKAGVPARVK